MRYTIIILSILIFNGCTRKSKITEPSLARVGSSVLTVEKALNSIPDHIINNDSVGALTRFRDDWIQQQIILQEAYRLRVHREKAIQDRITKLQDDYLARAAQDYIIGELEPNLSVTDEEARSYYLENKESFVLEERYVRYRHIIANSLSDAQNARQDLLRGIEWPEVAREYSINSEVAIRESQRFWPESMAGGGVEILNRYLGLIGLSEITVIERVGNRYHFVQLIEERAKGDHPDLDWLIDQIKEWLILEKRRRVFNSYVKNLYLQAQANNEIELYDVEIPNN